MNNNMNNVNIEQLMAILSKMSKEDINKGLSQASQILNNVDKEELLRKLKNHWNCFRSL